MILIDENKCWTIQMILILSGNMKSVTKLNVCVCIFKKEIALLIKYEQVMFDK